MLTREQLLAPGNRRTETIKFRGKDLFLREMSAGELMSFQRSIQSKKNGVLVADEESFAAKLLVRCIVDKDGKRQLEDSDWEAIHKEWSASEVQTALTIATRLNGYSVSAEGNA